MAIIIGIITGFLLCIPLGPVNILVINTGLKKGFSRALSIALGDSIMSAIYFIIITMGLTMITFGDRLMLAIKVIGIILIVLLGVKELIAKPVKIKKVNSKDSGKKRNYLLLGVAIYVSNPGLIVTLTGISAYIKSSQFFIESATNNILFSISVAIGTMLWFIFLLKMIKRFKSKMTDKLLNRINRSCGVLLLLLAAYMSYKVI